MKIIKSVILFIFSCFVFTSTFFFSCCDELGNNPVDTAVTDTIETDTGWIMIRDFNSGPVGNTTLEANDGFDDAAGNSYYNDQIVREGNFSCEINATKGESGFGNWGGIISLPKAVLTGGDIWWRADFYFPEGYDFTTNTGYLKFIRFGFLTKDGSHVGHLDNLIVVPGTQAGIFALLKEGVTNVHRYGDGSVPTGRWFTLEQHIHFDEFHQEEGGTAFVRTWLDNVFINEQTGLKTMTNSTDKCTSFMLHTYWNNENESGAPTSQKSYVDNIIIQTKTPSNIDSEGHSYIGDVYD